MAEFTRYFKAPFKQGGFCIFDSVKHIVIVKGPVDKHHAAIFLMLLNNIDLIDSLLNDANHPINALEVAGCIRLNITMMLSDLEALNK